MGWTHSSALPDAICLDDRRWLAGGIPPGTSPNQRFEPPRVHWNASCVCYRSDRHVDTAGKEAGAASSVQDTVDSLYADSGNCGFHVPHAEPPCGDLGTS